MFFHKVNNALQLLRWYLMNGSMMHQRWLVVSAPLINKLSSLCTMLPNFGLISLLHLSELRQELYSQLLIDYLWFILFKLFVVENLANFMTEPREVRGGLIVSFIDRY